MQRARQGDWPVALNSVSMHLPDVLTSIELGRLDALERVLRIALDARKDFGDWLHFVNKCCRSAGVMRSSLPVPIHRVPGRGNAVAQHWCPVGKGPDLLALARPSAGRWTARFFPARKR